MNTGLDSLQTIPYKRLICSPDIQAKDIIKPAEDESIFREWDDSETAHLSPCVDDNEYTVYQSRPSHRRRDGVVSGCH